jgi:Epoxide hydrolase N terminus
MSPPKPFLINTPQSKIDVLKQKLEFAEFPDELEGAGWDLECPLSEIQRLVSAWRRWDWRKTE